MSSISIIPTLDMAARQGAEINRDIQLNSGSHIQLYDSTNATHYTIEAILSYLQVTSNITSTVLSLVTSTPRTGTIGQDTDGLGLAPNASTNTRCLGNRALLIPVLGSDPAGAANGQIFYNTEANKFRVYENGAWQDMI